LITGISLLGDLSIIDAEITVLMDAKNYGVEIGTPECGLKV
jgi:hypothetical protein